MFSRQQLADDFRKLGVANGDTVMLHASVRAVGDVAGSPDEIHLALRAAVGNAGTVMMYVGSPAGYDDVGRGCLSAEEEAEVLAKQPAFDPFSAKAARDFGALAEFFRGYPGVRVNGHVTRFAAIGRNAETIVAQHPWNYAFGADTPLARLVRLDGKILLLGSDHDTVTFLHHVEHVTEFPNKIVARFKVPVIVDGARVWQDMEEFDTADAGAHAHWPSRFFAKIVDEFLRSSGNRGSRVGNAVSYVFSARELLEFAAPIMQAVALDARAADVLRETDGADQR
jgi:aminoglycoside 3-N-acetyltransferase